MPCHSLCKGRIPWIPPRALTPASFGLGRDDRAIEFFLGIGISQCVERFNAQR
jgi:hypothetical protein